MPRGMVLAAGRGTRLGPLTTHRPKPLLPVANRPVMAQGLARLRALGIDEIGVNISVFPEQFRAVFGDGAAHGVRLHWLQEAAPSGTAGGLKGLEALLRDDLVVVIAGDALLDLDLAPLLACHRAQGAFITLGTLPVADPSLYGVVVTDAAGRVREFQEKPAPGTAISHQANTGIYVFDPGVFDLIPAGAFCDFALDVFPEALRRGLPLYALPLDGYWTDIGNPGDYLQANLDYLDGGVRIDGDGTRVDGGLLGAGGRVDGARLARCVIGAGAVLPAGTALTDCVVWPGTVLAGAVTASAAVLTPHGLFQVDGRSAAPLAAGG